MSANMPQPTNHKRTSRSNSRSNSISSSVTTVKKSASVSSKTNPLAYVPRSQAASPGDALLDDDFLSPRISLAHRRGSFDDNKSPHNRNINRWSHSTTSSISGIDTEAARRRMQKPSQRMSIDPGLGGSPIRPVQSHDNSRNGLRQRPNGRNDSDPHSHNLHLTQKYPPYTRSPNSSATNLTPTSMFNTTTTTATTGDYFGDNWNARKQSNKLSDAMTAMSIAYTTTTNPKPRRTEDAPPSKASQPLPASPNHVAMLEQTQKPAAPAHPAEQYAASQQSPEQRKGRGHRSPTQKTMLSKALAKANTAVLLDNAQNIEGAIEAYAEACELLQQVMMRSSDGEDRKKLSAIRSTYSSRIAELHDLDDSFAGLMDKELPEDPPADDPNTSFFGSPNEPTAAEVLEKVHIPPRQESLLPQIFGGDRYLEDPNALTRRQAQPANLNIPMEAQYMPPPLSPRRLPSPPPEANTTTHSKNLAVPDQAHSRPRQHTRLESSESLSWLDTVDDANSSNSSRLSSLHATNQQTFDLVDDIEAEFDAALNAAVDAAYDDDLSMEDTPRPDGRYPKTRTPPRKHPSRTQNERARADSNQLRDDFLDEDTTEEEERLLDEMTQGFVFDDFHFDGKSKSALPRQSDSSSFSTRTMSSSVPSTTLTNGTTLSTLVETRENPKPPPSKGLPAPPIAQAPPAVPSKVQPQPSSPPKAENRFSGINLRDRRLSGQSARQLKIETYAPTRGTSQPPTKNGTGTSRADVGLNTEHRVPHTAPLPPAPGPPSTSTQATQPMTPVTSVHSGDSPTSESPATPALTQGGSQGSLEEAAGPPSSPLKSNKAMPPPPAPIRKNLSSSSLRMRNLSLTTYDESPVTPNSALFPDVKKGMPPLPTPTIPTLSHQTSQSGGMYLFDDQIGAAMTPTTSERPNLLAAANIPQTLEPCPESFLLRPWWLMRCLYQTVAHPRGGYLSTKLFLPREIWRVRNVKLKFVEEKVAQCDILTAALLQIAQVDQFDAEAVWQELQSFETILDQVRTVLQKKLGSDVGLSSSANVFKSPTEETETVLVKGNTASKSFASSWRKLRSKSSSATMTASSAASAFKDLSATHTNAGLTMSSLPMTSSSNVPSSRSHNARGTRPPPPIPTALTNIPIHHAHYMASLAKLFDAVQILDAVARQVVDPGLKCSSETHVGLELSMRNAADFFAFFIIRFVMADVGLLVDKFLKRGTEWVSS